MYKPFIQLRLLSIPLLAGWVFLATPADAQTKTAKTAKSTPAKETSAVSLPEGVQRITSVEGITEYQLTNGLRVLLFPDPSKPTITVNVTYLVGSRHEGNGETGMAHLLEHLVFKGTPNHPNIPQELTEHGARPNGTTWYDRTNYFETFNATDENLNWALDLEADRMVNSFIAKKDLESEMTVVRNEFEMGENYPQRVLMERVLSTAYLWHNYGKSTIGSREDIENVPIERLQAFYKKYYQPDNAVLLVAGKFDEAKTIALVQKHFGKIPRPERVLEPTYTVEPTQDGERSVTLRRVGDVQMVAAAYHTPPGSHADYAPVNVLVSVLTNEPSGRLYKALVEAKKASYVYGWTPALKEPGFAFFAAEMRKDQPVEEAHSILLNTFDALAKEPPTPEEVERAKNFLLKNFELNYTNSERVGLQMSEYIAMGDWRLALIYRDNLKAVTPADVQRVALAYFKPSNRTTGMFIPETDKPDRAIIPAAPDVQALVKDYKGEQLIAAGEVFDPAPENIDARTKRTELATIKYALLPKATRGSTVMANLTLRFGDEKSLMDKAIAGRFAASMLEKGTKTKTRQQIKDEFDRLKARVWVYGNASQANVGIETTRENLPAVMKLVAEILKEPTFPEKEFAELRQEILTDLDDQRSQPQAIAYRKNQSIMSPYPKGDIRYSMTFDEEKAAIEALTLDEVKKFYKEFYGASDATLAVVGDFDENAIRKITKSEFGSWKSPKPFERLVTKYFDIAPVYESLETPDKTNAMFLASLNLPIRDDDPDYPALVLGNYMLGGGFLNSRLATRIRQQEGLSYGVGSNLWANSLDKAGSFSTYAIYAPENAEKLEQAFKEEIEKMRTEGFTAEEVKAAKSGYLQSRQVNRSQDNSLAGTLNNYLFIKRDMKWEADFEKKIADLSPEQISSAMRKHIDPAKLVFIKAGDFEGAKMKAGEGKDADKPAAGAAGSSQE